MSKQFYITITIIFVCCSIGLGVITYRGISDVQEERAKFDQFQWVLPLSEEYQRFSSESLNSPYFYGNILMEGDVLMNQNGKVVAQGDNLFANEFSYSFLQGVMVGLKDYNGEMIIPARYVRIFSFDGNYGIGGTEEGEYQVFDNKGEILLTQRTAKTYLKQIEGKYFERRKGDDAEIYDVSTGKVAKNIGVYTDVSATGENYYLAKLKTTSGVEERYVFLDENFDEAFDGKTYFNAGGFSEGLCYVEASQGDEAVNGYINTQGEMVIKTGKSLDGGLFSEGKAIVNYKDRISCINEEGETVFEIPFKMDWNPHSATFCNGLAIVGYENNMGIVDNQGNWLLEPEFDLKLLKGDLISVNQGKKWGVMKIGGKS